MPAVAKRAPVTAKKLAGPQIQMRKISELVPYERNARTHSEEQIAQVAASIREFGWTNPILLDGESGVIAGHGRLAAARLLDLKQVPCIELAHLTDAQKRAYILADNKLALNAGWDLSLLAGELQDLKGLDFDLNLLGFGEQDLTELLAYSSGTEGLTDPDECPEVPANPVTKAGDLWILGKHRLLCGDATKAADVERLMAGKKARLCFTSPPYADQRDYESSVGDWRQLMEGVFSILPVDTDAQILVNLGLIHRDGEWIPYWDRWIEFMRNAGWRRFAWYVWDQGPGLPGDWNGRLAPSHEFIFHFNRSAKRAKKIVECKWAGTENHGKGLRARDGSVTEYSHAGLPVQEHKIADSVFRVMRHKARGIECEHPAVFPVELAGQVLSSFSDGNAIVYEPFAGSGSQIIAAEKCARICCAMEMIPAYCDIIVQRWQNFTGQEATLDRTKKTFAQISSKKAA